MLRRTKEVFDCFPETDHQLLTNRGFLFLDEVEAHVELNSDGTVRDWHGLRVATYDEKTQQLVYAEPRRLVVNKAGVAGGLVEITNAAEASRWTDKPSASSECGNGVSVVCTKNHMLYVRRDDASAFAKLPAVEVLKGAKANKSVSFLARAPNGVGLSAPDALCTDAAAVDVDAATQAMFDDAVVDDVARALAVKFVGAVPVELQSLGLQREQVRAFLALFGLWLGDGSSLADNKKQQLRSVTFSQTDVRFVEWLLQQCGLVRERGDYAIVDECVVHVRKSSWLQWWRSAAFGSSKCSLPQWSYSLSADLCRAVIHGAQLSHNNNNNNNNNCSTNVTTIKASSYRYRDDLMRLMLHAGYTATFARAADAATQDSWTIEYSDVDAAEPHMRSNSNVRSADVMREVKGYKGRTWCFDMNNGFVVVRRAQRVAKSEYDNNTQPNTTKKEQWVVTQVSRATIQGNCWFESGSMPYAQVHYPFENKEKFEKYFPANFIAEGVDQVSTKSHSFFLFSF